MRKDFGVEGSTAVLERSDRIRVGVLGREADHALNGPDASAEIMIGC
jgi:hypothetical protein